MDNKFYVSYEVARLLKEKGYTKTLEDFDFVYLKDGSLSPRVFLHTSPFISAPTKAEVIDWLESKGIRVEVTTVPRGKWRWSLYLYAEMYDSLRDYYTDYETRLEAEEAAIIKALELL